MRDKPLPNPNKTKPDKTAPAPPELAKETWPPPSEGNIIELLTAITRRFARYSYGLNANILYKGLSAKLDLKRRTINRHGPSNLTINNHDPGGPPTKYFNFSVDKKTKRVTFFANEKISAGQTTYKCALAFKPARAGVKDADQTKITKMVDTLLPSWEIETTKH